MALQAEGKEEVNAGNQQVELQNRLTEMQSKLKELESMRATVEGRLNDPAYLDYLEFRKSKVQGNDETEPDWDSLPNSEMAKHLSKRQQLALEKSIKSFESKMSEMEGKMRQAYGYFDLEINKVRTPELGKLLADEKGKNRFIQVAKENPSWSTDKVFQQIQMEDKVESDKKAESVAARKTEELKLIQENPDKVIPLATGETKQLSPAEAAAKAFEVAGLNKPIE